MAVGRGETRESVQSKADEYAVNALESLTEEDIELPRSAEVCCEYLGVRTRAGFALDARPIGRSTVGFKWSYRDDVVDVTQTVNVRYDYAVDHGSSLPEAWKNALKCRCLPRIAQDSAVEFAEQSGLHDVSCRVLGIPRAVTVHMDGRTEAGSILRLALGNVPVVECPGH